MKNWMLAVIGFTIIFVLLNVVPTVPVELIGYSFPSMEKKVIDTKWCSLNYAQCYQEGYEDTFPKFWSNPFIAYLILPLILPIFGAIYMVKLCKKKKKHKRSLR